MIAELPITHCTSYVTQALCRTSNHPLYKLCNPSSVHFAYIASKVTCTLAHISVARFWIFNAMPIIQVSVNCLVIFAMDFEAFWNHPLRQDWNGCCDVIQICGLLFRNREQVASNIWLISDSIHTNSVGYYGQWQSTRSILSIVKDVLLEEVY